MKFTIEGFNQERLMMLGLDIKDAMILRYFVDFKDGTTKEGKPSMISKIIKGEKFYWVKYEGIIKELPILKLGNVDSVYRRLMKMVKVKVLEHATIKQGGTYSYYKTGINYTPLITDTSELTLSDINPNGKKLSDKKPIGTFPQNLVENLVCSDENPIVTDINPIETDKKPNHSDEKSEQKIHLLYPSTINPSTKDKEVNSPSNLDKFFKSIRLDVNEAVFDKYIKDLNIKQDGDRIILETATNFNKTMIENMLLDKIQVRLKMCFDFKDIEIISKEE